ncbi:MAG: 3-deoxy-manno-octulosonate cytidylyltransferase [Ignavibacteria bacterium]|nr:MAG: 3-deoxy-manno-octulosonate cytidylyltransferase [Ignavibacteria bacterium]
MTAHTVIVIPARYGSTRFPGKPLADIAGKSMIERVYNLSMRSSLAGRVVVATDDERIRAEIDRFGGEAQLTPTDLASGSERMAYVAAHLDAEIYVNVQGDEPLLPPSTIDAVITALRDADDADIATASCPLRHPKEISDPNIVKLVTNQAGFALYFSRAGIPHLRDAGNEIPETGVYRKHIGIYAFRKDALLRFAALPPTLLEQSEKLEQLRALEHGMRIIVAEVEHDTQAVDTPEDIKKVIAALEREEKDRQES